ncbi:hypothetical protein E2320_021913 [Naja naja]|nr:hypothetical protein E2320_021913 [Naja naja]
MATEEEGGEPGLRWDNWKAWAALSIAEFAIILILAAGLAHLAIQQGGEDWLDEGVLSPLQRANQTIQVTAKRWESCRNHARTLEANASNLTSQVTELNTRLRLKELENKVLGGYGSSSFFTVALYIVATYNRQKEVIAHLQEQQLLIRDSVDTHHQIYLHIALASMLIATIVTLQV